jgi:hypothetical protein
MSQPLIDQLLTIEKYPGKGGWSYVLVKGVLPNKKAKFGFVRIKGTIDGFEIKQYNLMPSGKDCLFLPIKAEIRKKIKKEAGDSVHVVLYLDETPVELTEELKECFEFYPEVYGTYKSLTDSEKKQYLDWVYEAKQDETKVRRIAQMMDRLSEGKALHEM